MGEIDPQILAIYKLFELTGVFLMAVIGGSIARRHGFDFIGFIFLALITALGGGMLRDVIIGADPVAAVQQPMYLTLALSGALLAFVTKLHGRVWELFQVHADALVLGIWAVTGVAKSLAYGLPTVTAVLMGLITATGGGIIRDVIAGQTPQVFRGSRLYAAPALLSAVIAVSFHAADLDALGMLVSPVPATLLAVLSYWRNWSLPFQSDFSPVNDGAAQVREAMQPVENATREVGRNLEPQPLRRMRHRALEKAQEEIDAVEEEIQEAEQAVGEAAEEIDEVIAEQESEGRVAGHSRRRQAGK